MIKYYIETPLGSREITKQQYIEAKIAQFMNEPIFGRYSMSYIDIDLPPVRRLPKGV